MIRIITDSTCDVPDSLLEQLVIDVIPQTLIWGEKQYRDRIDIQPDEFYMRLEQKEERPRSSLITEASFHQAIEKAANTGADEVVVLTLSSTLSGTHENALRAAESSHIPVSVVDSNGTSMGLGWQVVAAARAALEGVDRVGIIEKINQVRSRITQMVGLETLDYLNRGGRIGAAVKLAGSVLKVKPIVAFNVLTNQVEPVGTARTYSSMVETLHRKFFGKINGIKNLHIAVLHGNRRETAENLAEKIRSEFHPLEIFVNSTGPVVGLHTGPGALGICGYAED